MCVRNRVPFTAKGSRRGSMVRQRVAASGVGSR